MENRRKLELELNQPMTLALIFDQPLRGESKYGPYYLYAVADPDSGNEYSFFAPVEVHEQLKEFGRGEVFSITKTAVQKGKKVVTQFNVQALANDQDTSFPPAPEPQTKPNGNGNGHGKHTNGNGNGNGNTSRDITVNPGDVLFNAMLVSYQDAIRIQEKLNGMCDVNRIAITLFIARSKTNGNGIYAG